MKKKIFFGIIFVSLFLLAAAAVSAGKINPDLSTLFIKPEKNFTVNDTAYIKLHVVSTNGPTGFTVNITLVGGLTNLTNVYLQNQTGDCDFMNVCSFDKQWGFRILSLEDVSYVAEITDNTTNVTVIIPTENNGTVIGDDIDGDGYYSEGSGGNDCNDNDAGVNPGAADNTNDGVDNDCDGSIDEDYSAPSSPSGGGGGGGGGGSTSGPLSSVIHNCLKGDVTVGKNDKIIFDYRAEQYTMFINDVLANRVQIKLYPIPSRDYGIDEGQSKYIDLDRNNRNDFRFEVKDVKGGKATIGCSITTEIGGAVEEEEIEETTPVLQNVKEGILKIASEVVPKNKASPVVGSLIGLAIVVAGLLVYYMTRKGEYEEEF